MTGCCSDRGWVYSQATWSSASRFPGEGVSEWLASVGRWAPVPSLGLLWSPPPRVARLRPRMLAI